MISFDTNILPRRLSAHVHLLPLPTNIGVVAFPSEGHTDVYLIDSGNDDLAADKILGAVEEAFPSPRVAAVLNTHTHADHCGGNALVHARTGCGIWASRGEAALLENPGMETALLWGGTPVHDIRSKYLTAKPSRATRTLDAGERIQLGPVEIEAVPLPGHYHDPLGFLVSDSDGRRTLFLGDAVSGRNVIRRYWIQYLLDEPRTKETLRAVERIEAETYVPGHGDTVEEIEGLAELNLLAILETEDMILDELREPKSAEEILKAVADRSGIRLGLSQFVIIGSTIRSYLAGLYESGRAAFEMGGGRMLWRRIRPPAGIL